MSEKCLKDEQLNKVKGGGNFEVSDINDCKYSPSKWVKAPFATGDFGKCGSCIFNPNRAWKDSWCDWPKEYENDNN